MLTATSADAQVFWTENFETGASTGLEVSSYTGPNGAWTMTTGVSSTEGDQPNTWYVSCEEAGHLVGVCGTTCASSTGLGATLHLGGNPTFTGDAGAAYDAGGLCSIGFYCVETDRRAESPTINCTGKIGITLKFYYIEGGQTTIDDGTVWYSADNGSSWSLLTNPAKTVVCSGGQGQWNAVSVALPASANNNPTVKVAFRWVNNDGIGTDPSFAVDSVSLSTTSSAAIPTAAFTFTPNDSVCKDSCIVFTNTSVGTVDSIKWIVTPGGAAPFPTVNPFNLCFTAVGTYTVGLMAFGGGAGLFDTATAVVTVTPRPSPVLTKVGHTMTVPSTYSSYQWYNGTTPIAGATNNTYTYTTAGSYTVRVDSVGAACKGVSKLIYTAGVNTIGAENNYWISQTGYNTIILHSSDPLDEPLSITITDATGRVVTTTAWEQGATLKQLDNVNLAAGLYIVRITNNTHTAGTVLKLLTH